MKGPLPIYLRFTADGQRFEIATKRECEPERWNSAAGRKLGSKEDAKSLNAFLDIMQTKVYDAQRLLLSSGKLVTADSVKNLLLGIEEKPKLILDIFRIHNEEMRALIGKDYTESTCNRYDAALGNVRQFLRYKYKLEDYPIDSLDYSFIKDYAFYLKTVRHISHNTAMRYLKYFKKVVLICVKSGWITRDPFHGFKITFKDNAPVPLSQKELSVMVKKEFINYRIRKVRDIFIFCCYTGVAYVDVKNLRKSDIVIGHDGKQWLMTNRQKTGTPSRIPLLPVALSIIKDYENDPACINEGRLLPVLSNQKMNAYIKEIADVCGIDRPITFHLARHTFATTVTLANDVPIETVSKMLGHKSLKSTQHYARIVDRKVSKDMEKLSEKLA